MDNKIFIGLTALIAVAVVLDMALNGFGGFVFLARKVLDLAQAIAFWRH